MIADLVANSVEYYDNPDEVFTESDVAETDCHIVGWGKKFRIRALTFGQQEKINQLAVDEKTGNLRHDEFIYHTIAEGVIRPHFNITQSRKLCDNNGEFVKKLSEEIWALGRVSKREFDNYIDEQKQLIAAINKAKTSEK